MMGISHSNVIRQKVIENLDRPYIVNAITGDNGQSIHPAMVRRRCVFCKSILIHDIWKEKFLFTNKKEAFRGHTLVQHGQCFIIFSLPLQNHVISKVESLNLT